jgi:ubiquinone/menaquinone biosynthesis C-methylase UbiE
MANSQPSTSTESFQVPLEVAERYESAFVPAFFAQWAPLLCRAAGVGPGQRVLDVACGTGIVARTAAERVGPAGRVVGVDLNEAMLTVARRVCPGLVFHRGDALALPVDDGSFDVALSQMALMFFPDRAGALAELRRAVVPGGTVGLLVPGRLDAQAAFAPFVAMVARHAGPEAIELLSTYFACGDLDALAAAVAGAGLQVTTAVTEQGVYRAPSVDAFVTTEVESTPLVERLTEETYAQVRADAQEVLAPFTTPDGAVEAPFVVDVVVARRP